MNRRWLSLFVAALLTAAPDVDGKAAYEAFLQWRHQAPNAKADWDEAVARYRARLRLEGKTPADAEKILSIIAARDEATLYDPAYSAAPKLETKPNRLLQEAVKGRKPGRALDVGMGQGRNSVYLAKLGWNVTGFDVSAIGLEKARKQAAEAGVEIDAVHASDEEFDFGVNRWDLIAILYPIEKRSVFRVEEALKPGGLVVFECGLKQGGKAPFEYDSGELPQIFKRFGFVKYEEVLGIHDWVQKKKWLVRLIAQKPL